MRRFGEYYDRRFHNPELKLLIQEIIERYELNRKMRIHDRVWLSDEYYLEKMRVKSVLGISGELGVLIKFALYSGLRGEEITYVHNTPVCDKLSGCGCKNLHLIDKNGYSIIVLNRVVGQKHSYFTITPTKVWESFRSLPKVEYEQRKVAHGLLKSHTNGKVAFMDLRS
jgi:hypothetical protein